eukprot:TCALIF_05422-PA protein Name:"Similar to YLR339C Putative uncharacterized protein YLR339C (Saccharomyces cerevisiae (strain ATCC 204508 / S288c))" AED:0.10 eAED:0.10 QI:0/-1/0/1/-1/1/1/0/152
MLRRVASDRPTLSPVRNRFTSWTISIVPLVILVGMFKAWKNEVFSGPSPVFCAGTTTSKGAMAPARAGALTLLDKRAPRMVPRSSLVNTNPTLPRICGNSFSRAGFCSRCPRIALRIMVFLPMRMTALPRSIMRICCICLEPTLSASTCKDK